LTDRYAVIGHPVAHSRSPRIHALFAQSVGHAIEYGLILGEPGHFREAVDRFRAAGGRGVNVTVPFKLDAFELASERTGRATQAGAVNTLAFDGARVIGDNTDGAGLVRDIVRNRGFAIAGKRVLLMGAGGAARGVVLPLLDEQPASLAIANRTADKAQVYGEAARPFLMHALGLGASAAADGLGMLVEQAAESFWLWRGVRPPTAPVLERLRADLARAAGSSTDEKIP
jgi:shikimate dehydrogenase